MQRKVLEERKKEIEKLRGWGTESHTTKSDTGTKVESHSHSLDGQSSNVSHSHPGGAKSHSHSSDAHSPGVPSQSHPSNAAQVPLKRSTPSSSRKRHANIIEAKNRQLVEEEGLAFRQQQMKQPGHRKKREGVESVTTPTTHGSIGVASEGATTTPPLLHIPPPDSKWYDTGPATPLKRAELHSKDKVKKKVHFDAEAIVLNAALEGELELLKECTRKVSLMAVSRSVCYDILSPPS